MLLPMEEDVLHEAPPLGQGLPFLTVFNRIYRDAFEPQLNRQWLHLDCDLFIPTRKKVLTKETLLCVAGTEAFRLDCIICKSNALVVSGNETESSLVRRYDIPVDLLDEAEPDCLVSRPFFVRKILNPTDQKWSLLDPLSISRKHKNIQ